MKDILVRISEDEMKLEITVCPACGRNISKVKEDWIGEYKNSKYTVPDLEYYLCGNCDERVYSREAMRKIEASSPAFQATESVE